MSVFVEPAAVTDPQAEAARQALAALDGNVRVDVKSAGGRAASVVLPAAAVRLLVEILDGMAAGREMRVAAASDDLSVSTAAEALDVPESYVAGLIDRGELAARRSAAGGLVVSAAQVRAYKADLRRRRLESLAELQVQAQELGMGYE